MSATDEAGADPGAMTRRPAGDADEVMRRWRLILGGGEADGTGFSLGEADAGMDATLGQLYEQGEGDQRSGSRRQGGLGGSAPRVARWLGDIRTYFPSSVVQVMQRDAITRLGLRELLLEPEMLDAVQPDIHLVSTLISLNRAIPEQSRESARTLVRAVVKELEERLAAPTRQAITGALDKSSRNRRPKLADIDWPSTIAANLRHYQPEYRTVIPETLIGYGRKNTQVLRDVILCIDQSGSMAESVIYSSVFGAVMASLRAVDTRLVVFDTAVVDLTDEMDDPVDVLFGVQLGGGTDINGALSYCQTLITRPAESIVVLISDLYEGGVREGMLERMAAMTADGVQVIALLALSDSGAPSFDAGNASALAELGIPAFACTPDLFPDLMAAAISKRDIGSWAAANEITLAAPTEAIG